MRGLARRIRGEKVASRDRNRRRRDGQLGPRTKRLRTVFLLLYTTESNLCTKVTTLWGKRRSKTVRVEGLGITSHAVLPCAALLVASAARKS